MIIEEKTEALTNTNKPMVKWVISGKKFNTFNEDYNKFKLGDHVKLTTEVNGKYTNIKTMELSTPEESQKEAQNGSNTLRNEAGEIIKGIIINKTQSPNSYEFGKAGNRFKLYFEDVEDLKHKIEELIAEGLYLPDVNESLEIQPNEFGRE